MATEWRSGRARSARRPAACGSRSRTVASCASAATRTTRSRRASSVRRARRSARSTTIPTGSAGRSCAATARTWRSAGTRHSPRSSGGSTAVVARTAADAVAVYFGNPNAHNFANTLAIRPLVKALGTKNVYSASTVDQMPKHVACGLVFGHPLAIPVPDIDRTDFLLLLGANPLESNGSLATAPDWPGRLDAIRRRGGRVVVVDPRRTRTAERADLHVPIRPGTDAALLAGIAHTLFAEGLVAPGTAHRADATGSTRSRQAVAGFTPGARRALHRRPGRDGPLARAGARGRTDGRRLRADRHPHDRVRHARGLARRRAQRPHGQPRPAGRCDVPPRRPRAAGPRGARLPHRALAEPGARAARGDGRAAGRDARGRDRDARQGPGAGPADGRRQPGADHARRGPARAACSRGSS